MALVFAVALAVLMTGSTTIGLVQDERSQEEARLTMESADGDLTRLTNSGRTSQARFSLGQVGTHDSQLVRQGHLNVTVNRNATCSTEIPLSSIRYESQDGQTVAYEAGGVWRQNRNGTGSAMQTEPDVGFRNGSIEVTVTNLTGQVSDSENRAFYNVTSSRNESAWRNEQLFVGSCSTLDNVTIAVQSDFYRAWSTYLANEFDVETRTFESNRTTVVHLDQSRLPPRVNQSRNRVINLSGAPYMETVSITDDTIRVSKDISREYSATVSTLAGRRLDIGEIRSVENGTTLSSGPRDFVFVIDESGSMAKSSPGEPDRYVAAQNAIQQFVGTLDESRDRVALVGYSHDYEANVDRGPGLDECEPGNTTHLCRLPKPTWASPDSMAWAYNTSGEILTDDFDGFNDTVQETSFRHNTGASAGIHRANQVMQINSDQTRRRVMILLSDGAFNSNQYPGLGHGEDPSREAARRRAETSAEMGIPIYAVGFGAGGGDYSNETLDQLGDITGGENYTAANQDQLVEVFENISQETRPTVENRIVRTPTSTNLTTGSGDVLPPDIVGNADEVASTTIDGNQFDNINDPNVQTQFGHSFALADNESLSFNASTYECADYEGTGNFRVHNGSAYEITRCANMTTVNESIPPSNITVYTDGDDLTSLLDDTSPAWWQESIESTLDRRSDISLDSTVVSMPSNYALVILDYPDGVNSSNELALLYELGISESQYTPEGVINIQVNDVAVRD